MNSFLSERIVPLNGFGVISCNIGGVFSSKLCFVSRGISVRESDSISSLSSIGISPSFEKSLSFSSSIGISCNSNSSGSRSSGTLGSSII